MNRFALAAAATALTSGLPLLATPAHASNLNTSIDDICKGFAILNKELGASAAPGAPAGRKMQQELNVTDAQYGSLWSLMKLTPTRNCVGLY